MRRIALLLSVVAAIAAGAAEHVMLSGEWVPENTHLIDFEALPRVPVEHAVICDVCTQNGASRHNYLTHYEGRFWAMWSDRPCVEERAGQRVKFATSPDGLSWGQPEYLSPAPPNTGPDSPAFNTRSSKGMRYISRGFWQRDGELLALASLDEAAGFFDPSLALHAFRFDPANFAWDERGIVFDDTINVFPPLRLRSGEWMMSRRTHDYRERGVQFIVGGVRSLDDWHPFPVQGTNAELKAEELDWWELSDRRLSAVFRDNHRSGFLYRSYSADDGRTWGRR